MTHTVSIDVGAPVQLYDAFHAALVDHTGVAPARRRLVHRARGSATGREQRAVGVGEPVDDLLLVPAAHVHE